MVRPIPVGPFFRNGRRGAPVPLTSPAGPARVAVFEVRGPVGVTISPAPDGVTGSLGKSTGCQRAVRCEPHSEQDSSESGREGRVDQIGCGFETWPLQYLYKLAPNAPGKRSKILQNHGIMFGLVSEARRTDGRPQAVWALTSSSLDCSRIRAPTAIEPALGDKEPPC